MKFDSPVRDFLIMALSLASAIMLGCVATTIVSNKDVQYYNKISRPMIIVETSASVERDFVLYLEFELIDQMKNVGVDAKIVFPTGLELNDEIDNQIKEYIPDVIILLSQSELFLQNAGMGNTTTCGITFNAKTFDVATSRDIWRAKITSKSTTGFTNRSAICRSLSVELVKKLREDGLINNVKRD